MLEEMPDDDGPLLDELRKWCCYVNNTIETRLQAHGIETI